MKMGTCADCGQPMHRGTTSLPQGVARCLECRATTRRTPEEMRQRKREYARSARRDSCPDCGGMKWRIAERCRQCADRAKIIRAKDDSRLLRKHRESAAPGISWTARKNLLAKWKRQGKRCTYCDRLADTIDHAVPLVRGGTNYEGNLVPACKACNSSKSGYLIAEWRTGKRLPRMTNAPEWKRPRKPIKPIKTIKGEQPAFNVCPECGSLCVNRYCNSMCGTRYTTRRNYRLKVGIPLDAPLYQSDKPQWRRTWVA